ncbi:hypothetical protein CPB86DRAFT_804020 [Serendipita vermifera]|nr:hypothetical protein CPB86DRAFT_804020 [Serendipita vermifera]
MADSNLPSRFVSQQEIESANAKREEAWKAAYARIGQEPPPKPEPDVYDGRSLAEKLAANRAAKQEEYENAHKLSAQFRSLDPDEINFLDSVALKKYEEEKLVRQGDEEELKSFRAAVQARDSELSGSNIPIPSPLTTNAPTKDTPSTSSKAQQASKSNNKPKAGKPGLKGVVVNRKRAKPSDVESSSTPNVSESKKPDINTDNKEGGATESAKDVQKQDEGDRKRRRIE